MRVHSLFLLTELADYGDAGPHHAISSMQPIVAHGNKGVGDGGGEKQCIHSDHLYEAAAKKHTVQSVFSHASGYGNLSITLV